MAHPQSSAAKQQLCKSALYNRIRPLAPLAPDGNEEPERFTVGLCGQPRKNGPSPLNPITKAAVLTLYQEAGMIRECASRSLDPSRAQRRLRLEMEFARSLAFGRRTVAGGGANGKDVHLWNSLPDRSSARKSTGMRRWGSGEGTLRSNRFAEKEKI